MDNKTGAGEKRNPLTCSHEIFYKIIILALSAIFISYEVIRALNVSLTLDEALTYNAFVSPGFFAAFNLKMANNHFLNSLLVRILCFFFDNNEFILRLPNLAGYVLYLVFSLKLLNMLFNRLLVIAGFLLLNLNPYVLDYFSLSRGYGLSLGILMAALYFFSCFLDSILKRDDPFYLNLRASFVLAICSVLSHFSVLNVHLSLMLVAILFLFAAAYKNRDLPLALNSEGRRPSRLKGFCFAGVLLAVPFNLLFMAQYLRYSGKLAEPVELKISGIAETEKHDIEISGITPDNDRLAFLYENGVWKFRKKIHLGQIMFQFPSAVFDKIDAIEIQIGPQKFQFGTQEIKKWKQVSSGKNIIYYSDPSVSLEKPFFADMKALINWSGDAFFLRLLSRAFFFVLILFTASLALIYGLGQVAIRASYLGREQFNPLFCAAFLTVIFMACPLSVLKRNHALNWGGHESIIHDTFFSLVNQSFHKQIYGAHQAAIVFIFVIISIIIFLIFMIRRLQKKELAQIRFGASLLAIIVLSSFSIILQWVIFGNPYLRGRTALFFIPLYTLFLISLFHELFQAKKIWKIAGLAVMTTILAGSTFHFTRSANFSYALEWKNDADTKSLIKDLTSLQEKESLGKSKLKLWVEWMFYPSVQYYKGQKNLTWLEVKSGPLNRRINCDYYYCRNNTFQDTDLVFLKKYKIAGNILAKKPLRPAWMETAELRSSGKLKNDLPVDNHGTLE